VRTSDNNKYNHEVESMSKAIVRGLLKCRAEVPFDENT